MAIFFGGGRSLYFHFDAPSNFRNDVAWIHWQQVRVPNDADFEIPWMTSRSFPRKRLKQCNFGSKNLRTIQNLRRCFALASCGRSDHLLWSGTLSIDKLSNLDDSW